MGYRNKAKNNSDIVLRVGATLTAYLMDLSMEHAARESLAQANAAADCLPLPLKKRGRPRKDDLDIEPVQWTMPMIQQLLEQRELYKNEFLDSKDKTSLARGWSKIVLFLQTTFSIDFTASQVKSKYQSLQKTFRQHNAADKKTGNGPIPKKPACWDDLVSHFGGRAGLAHDSLMSSQVPYANVSVSSV